MRAMTEMCLKMISAMIMGEGKVPASITNYDVKDRKFYIVDYNVSKLESDWLLA